MNYIQFTLVLFLTFSFAKLEKLGFNKNKNEDTKVDALTEDFCLALGNNLMSNKKQIADCIPQRWRAPYNVISKNVEFKCISETIKQLIEEIKNYQKFFVKKLNYECHYSGQTKGIMIENVNKNKAKEKKIQNQQRTNVQQNTNQAKVPKFIQLQTEITLERNNNPPEAVAQSASGPALPTNKKFDSSNGNAFQFFTNNLDNFRKNILGLVKKPCFPSFLEMLACAQQKETEKGEFTKTVLGIQANIKKLAKYGIKSEIVMGIDVLCNWKVLKNALNNFEKGMKENKNQKDKWNYYAIGFANLLKTFSI